MTRRALKRYCLSRGGCFSPDVCPVLDEHKNCKAAYDKDGKYVCLPRDCHDSTLHERVDIEADIPGLVPRWAAVSIIMATKAAKLLLQAVLIGLVVRWML